MHIVIASLYVFRSMPPPHWAVTSSRMVATSVGSSISIAAAESLESSDSNDEGCSKIQCT